MSSSFDVVFSLFPSDRPVITGLS